MRTHTVKIRVRCFGKAPKQYGSNAYKFGVEISDILKANGWVWLHRGRNYDYFALPEGQAEKEIIVSASVPTDAEIERIAAALHEAGKRVIEKINGWIVTYRPVTQYTSSQVDILDNNKQIGPTETSTLPSLFTIGSLGAWCVHLCWENGDDKSPHWHKFEDNIVSGSIQDVLAFEDVVQDKTGGNIASSILPLDVLREGEIQQGIVSLYERNPEARRRCIEHYGPHCAVCDFNFAEKYGDIGKGFIHVHHLKSLADIGQEYEVSPIHDLRPVCPNCHAMLHRRTPPYNLSELQSILKND